MSKKIAVTKDNWNVGDKVVRGKDWCWGDQDKEAVYGIIQGRIDLHSWVSVYWVNEKGQVIDTTHNYRVGANGRYDLYFHTDYSSSKFFL